MRAFIFISSIAAIYIARTTATYTRDYSTLDKECAHLGGALRINEADLPPGTTPDQVRKCRDHPLGNVASYIQSPNHHRDLSKANACWWGKSVLGCTRGWCWKSCGKDGQWCWMARKDGFGDWWDCRDVSNCKPTVVRQATDCGWGCSKECGCSC